MFLNQKYKRFSQTILATSFMGGTSHFTGGARLGKISGRDEKILREAEDFHS